MDDLIDLLAYDCPLTGKRRVPGFENGELFSKFLGCNCGFDRVIAFPFLRLCFRFCRSNLGKSRLMLVPKVWRCNIKLQNRQTLIFMKIISIETS